jgi:hypothetical protein
MPLIGGKNAKKKSSSSTKSKRHFTVVMGNKEHGLYVSSSPSSAARKAVSKLCATDKKRKVDFHIREITQGSKKKTYGPYLGYIEKLKEPIELKGRVIKYKPVAKLSDKKKKTEGEKKKGSILVVEAKDSIVSTKKRVNKGMKKMKKTYHKGGEITYTYAVRSIPTPDLQFLATVAKSEYMYTNGYFSDIMTKLQHGIGDRGINRAEFTIRKENPTLDEFNDFNELIKENSIIECYVNPDEYPNERWFGIVTGITDTGVYVKWLIKNSFEIDKDIKNPQYVDFLSIKGILIIDL